MVETKCCIECGEVKPITEFYAAGRNRSGFNNKCKKCVLAYGREYKARLRAEGKLRKRKKSELVRGPRDVLHSFGPAYEFWSQLLLKQKGKENASV